MSRIAYVNGRYVPHAQAAVHIEDRGYQFADGVYEVCEIRHDKIVDQGRHLDRLDRSLRELEINWPVSRTALLVIMRELVRKNRVHNGLVYLQVTRGVAPRDHGFPSTETPAALVITAKSVAPASPGKLTGIEAISVPDNRWERVDIKTVSLLPNCLAKEQADRQGAGEAIFVDVDGNVTEGSSTNVWIVTQDNDLITRPAEQGILRGITRQGVLDTAASLGLTVTERAFSLDEAKQAREVFLTSATKTVKPILRIDAQSIGNGDVGEVTTRLRQAFHDHTEHSSPVSKFF